MKALLLAGIAMTSCASVAKADLISTFTASGQFEDGALLGGTVMIDVTTGIISGVTLSLGLPDTNSFSYILMQGSDPQTTGEYLFKVGASASNTAPLLFLGTVSLNLIGFSGGDLASYATPSSTGYVSAYYPPSTLPISLTSGRLTLVTASVPEPTSFALLGLGVAGIMAMGRRRGK